MKLSKTEMKKRRIRNREGKNRNESRGKSNQSSSKGMGTNWELTNWEPQTQPTSPDEHEQGESNPTGIRAGKWGKNSNAFEQNRPRFFRNQTKIELESINYKKFETQS